MDAAGIDTFRIAIPDRVLDDLRRRIARTRWPIDPGNTDWRYGTNLATLRELSEYWRDGFDWRAQEARLNRLPQFRTEIDGTPVHFIHIRGKGPTPIPLVMSHGWPWTFGGDVYSRFMREELLTNFTIYWATQSLASSIRFYAEGKRDPWRPSHPGTPLVTAPTGIAIMANDMVKLPRRWAERYYNLQRWRVISPGGHFAPMEEPARLVDEIRTFFRALR